MTVIGCVITGLLGLIVVLIGYIWHERQGQLKADRLESVKWREEFHDKFEAINTYISEDKEKTKALGQSIGVLFKKNGEHEKAIHKLDLDLSKLKPSH